MTGRQGECERGTGIEQERIVVAGPRVVFSEFRLALFQLPLSSIPFSFAGGNFA
jgi:hypothetical protein